jgi:hypothetical protein
MIGSRRTKWRTTLVLAGLLGLSAAPTPSASQEVDNTPVAQEGGLFRDSRGRYWCGATCNREIGQVCCTFTYPS